MKRFKSLLSLMLLVSIMIFARCGPVWAGEDLTKNTTEVVTAMPDQTAVDAVGIAPAPGAEIEVIQKGDSVTIMVNGVPSTFYVPADSGTGKAITWGAAIIALLLSLVTWYRTKAFKHRMSNAK